jgi:pimeloyl-ACP methyl ester carboxylesterase
MPRAVLAHASYQDAAGGPRPRIVKDSGHDIHQDQPELVTEAIRQVVAGVRDRDTWYDLKSCCAN